MNKFISMLRGAIDKLPNLEKRFPTEHERYAAFIKLLYFSLAIQFIGILQENLFSKGINLQGLYL